MPRDEAARTVLLVDGEVLVRLELSEYLRDCGYHVIEAATSDEALTVLSRPGLAIDAVLCDAGEMGDGAFALARWLHDERPDLPVLLAGTPVKAADAAGALCDEGPTLARPYDPAVVVDRIRRRLAARDRDGAR